MKKQWELNRLKALAEEEELKAEVEEDEMFFTASRQLLSQVPRRSRGVRMRRGTRGIRGQSLSSRGAHFMSDSSNDTLSHSLYALPSPTAGVIRGSRGRGRRPRSMGQSLVPNPFPHPLVSSSPPPPPMSLSGSLLDTNAPPPLGEISVSGSIPPSATKTVTLRKTLPKMEPADEDIDNDDPDDVSFGERRVRGRGRSSRPRGGGVSASGRRPRARGSTSHSPRVDLVSIDDADEEDELPPAMNNPERANHIRGRAPISRGKRSLPTSGASGSVPSQLQFEIPTAPPGLQPKRSAPPPPPIPVPISRSVSVRQPVPVPQSISASDQMNLSLPAPHFSELITKSCALAPGVPKSSIGSPIAIRSSLRAGQPDFDSAAAAFRPRSPLAIRPVRISGGSNSNYEVNNSFRGAQSGLAVPMPVPVRPVSSRPSAVTIVTYRPNSSVGYIPAPAVQSPGSVPTRPEATSVQLIPLRPQRFPRPTSLRAPAQLTIQPIAMRVPASRPGGPRPALSSAAAFLTHPSTR